MSRASSDDAPVGFYRKPGADLYTVLLLVAFLALAVGTVFLYLETAEYGPTPAGEPSVQTGFYQPAASGGSTILVARQAQESSLG